MRTKQGRDFVSLLYAKQILMQKQINIDTQFLGRAEGSFQDGRSRIKYFATSDKIYDMKTLFLQSQKFTLLNEVLSPSNSIVLGIAATLLFISVTIFCRFWGSFC